MKYIKILTLSIIILICCLCPVISAELNDTGDNTNLTADNHTNLNNFGKKGVHFKIDPVDTYYVGDNMRFHVTFDPNFNGPIKINLDNYYTTTTTSNTGQFYITFESPDLAPGRHFFEVEFDGDDQWFYGYACIDFTVKDKAANLS